MSDQATQAYSVIALKSVDEERRIISGIATTPTPDRGGDVVNPFGATFGPNVPLLLYHDRRMPVGTVKFGTPTKKGIPFEAHIPFVLEEGVVKERTNEAFHSAKYGLLRGASVGISATRDDVKVNKHGGLDWEKYTIDEMSMVTLPQNVEATITQVKSAFGLGDNAASGVSQSHVHKPGVSGAVVTLAQKGAAPMKPIAEQKAAYAAEKTAKVAALNAIMGEQDGTTLSAEKQAEFDAVNDEIRAIDGQLSRLETLEQVNKANATPVAGNNGATAAAARAGGHQITIKQALPAGIGFARAVKAAVVARIDGRNLLDVAKEMYPSDDRLHSHIKHVQSLPMIISQIKAAVPAGTTSNTTWASALVDPTNLAGEFIEFLRPATILGKLNLRRVPFNVRMIEQTQGGTGYWVGQGAPKPLTAFGYAPVTLGFTKVAAITVITEELARFSTPSAEMLTRDGLRDTLVERIDRDLLDPAEAGTANVQPASLTNGVLALTSAGTSADNVRTDLGKLVRALRTANVRGPIAIVMPDSLVTALTFMVNALGQSEFPDLSADGGTIRGLKIVPSEYVANSSGAGNMVVAIAEREVFLADDDQVVIDASREASLQMSDAPSNNAATAAGQSLVSMWQTNSIALRAERFVNWSKRRSSAVAWIDDVNWGSVGSPA